MVLWLEILGVKVKISFFTILMITFFSLLNSGNIYLHALFVAFIHEFGHLAATIIVDCKISCVEFLPFGIRMRLAAAINTLPRHKSLLIIIFGPLANILSFFSIFLLSKKMCDAAIIHLATAIFNLLPIGTLDGGKILCEILGVWFEFEKSQQICDVISLGLAVGLFFLGFVLLIYTGYNFSLILTAIYLSAVIIYKQKPKSEIFSRETL